jgi:hypothetical protein
LNKPFITKRSIKRFANAVYDKLRLRFKKFVKSWFGPSQLSLLIFGFGIFRESSEKKGGKSDKNQDQG